MLDKKEIEKITCDLLANYPDYYSTVSFYFIYDSIVYTIEDLKKNLTLEKIHNHIKETYI